MTTKAVNAKSTKGSRAIRTIGGDKLVKKAAARPALFPHHSDARRKAPKLRRTMKIQLTKVAALSKLIPREGATARKGTMA
jgi:hypothetical protein